MRLGQFRATPRPQAFNAAVYYLFGGEEKIIGLPAETLGLEAHFAWAALWTNLGRSTFSS
jgi:hypothetical protein